MNGWMWQKNSTRGINIRLADNSAAFGRTVLRSNWKTDGRLEDKE